MQAQHSADGVGPNIVTTMVLAWRTWPEAIGLIVRGATFDRTWRVALVVGTVLSLGNQATHIVDDPGNWVTWVRVGFNYVVPFLVASVGYLTAFRVTDHAAQRDGGDELR